MQPSDYMPYLDMPSIATAWEAPPLLAAIGVIFAAAAWLLRRYTS